jgi:hypothetical protein
MKKSYYNICFTELIHTNKFEDLILNYPAFITAATQLKNIYRIIINNISPKILFFCHPASCTMGTGSFSQSTADWVWPRLPAPSSAEVKERVAIPLNLLSAFMACSWVKLTFFNFYGTVNTFKFHLKFGNTCKSSK